MTYNKRLHGIDTAKGIGIFLVIIGHYMNYGVARELIYAFHMPLFFFIGGYLYNSKPVLISLKTNARRLIVPYIITGIVILCYYCVLGYKYNNFSTACSKTIAILYCSGAEGIHSKYLAYIPTTTPIWFLVALFWCKFIYNLIPKYKVPISMGIGILSIYIQYYVINFPLCILVGCSAMIFYAIGNLCRDKSVFERFNWIAACVCLLLWLYIGSHFRLRMYMCKWDNVLLNIIGAISAIYLIFHLSKKLKLPIIEWFGRNSLTILCVHTFFYETRLVARFTGNILFFILNDVIASVIVIYSILFFSRKIDSSRERRKARLLNIGKQ